jgi:hypothetical protein
MRIQFCLLVFALAANADAQPYLWSAPVVEVFVPPVLRPETDMAFGRARRVATEIYAAIGVRVVWRSGGRPPMGCAKHPMRGTIVVRFDTSDAPFASDQALAWSNPYSTIGPCVTVLMHRVEAAVRTNPLSTPSVLGHVLAHEMGHVLQGVARHSNSGLMRGQWPLEEVREIMKGHSLEFAPYDSELIRANLGTAPLPGGRKFIGPASVAADSGYAKAESAFAASIR